LPPILDESLVTRLGKLADQIDGARLGEWDEWLAEFNLLAGTNISFEEFQGIYGGQDHIDWVKRVLTRKMIRPVLGVTRDELVEVARRAMPQNGDPRYDAYLTILDINTDGAGSRFIFYPPDYDPSSNTWGNGRPISEYDPSPEQIIEWLHR